MGDRRRCTYDLEIALAIALNDPLSFMKLVWTVKYRPDGQDDV